MCNFKVYTDNISIEKTQVKKIYLLQNNGLAI